MDDQARKPEDPSAGDRFSGGGGGESGGGLGRTLRLAALVLALILGGIGVFAWVSSGSDADLPFGYEGFD